MSKNHSHILILILLSVTSCHTQKTTENYNYEYHSYKPVIYYDNMLASILPEVFSAHYYSTIGDKQIRKQYKEYNTQYKENRVHITTKAATKGYLHVNKIAMNYIEKSGFPVDNITIIYIHNGKIASTLDEVTTIMRLRKKDILNLTMQLEANLLSVNITAP